MITLLFSLPGVYAQSANVSYNTTYLFVGVSEKTIGVGQQLLLVYWTSNIPPDIGEINNKVSSPTTRAGWDGVTLAITKPDGTNETVLMPRSDPVGGGYYPYIPQQTGTYSVQAFFPAVWKNSTESTARAYYTSAISTPENFTVETEPVGAWEETPLPNSYWERPIDAMNRDWYVLAGNWLGGAATQPIGYAGGATARLAYGQGPESAHVVWTKPYYAGGIMDERFGDMGFQTYHYDGIIFRNPVIIDGRIYYATRVNAHLEQGYNAISLYTGETIDYWNATPPAFGAIYNYGSPNQHGGFPYLWRTSGVTLPAGYTSRSGTTSWEMIDAFTGNSITKIANVSASGTAVYGKDGSILRYNLVNSGTPASPAYWLQVWNTSAIPTELLGTTGTNYWQWRPERIPVHNGDNGFSLNISLSNDLILGPRNSIVNQTGTIRTIREGDQIIIGTAGQNNEIGAVQGRLVTLSLVSGQEGTKMADISFTPPSSAGNKTIDFQGVDPEDGVFIFGCSELRTTYVYSLATGQQLWASNPEPSYNYYYWSTYESHREIYNGMLISAGYSGVLTAYNITTGQILWVYTAENFAQESPYGNIPVLISAICDGKIYVGTGEHSPSQPLWRNPHALACIDAQTGQRIWGFPVFGVSGVSGTDSGGASYVIGDGHLVALNAYDGQLYSFAKGPSDTSVFASPKSSVMGTSIVIDGSVFDISPGTKQQEIALRFPDGVPAASDDTMTDWMMHVYMQQTLPTNATGVPVSLDVIDANGNYRHIGNATTDAKGYYSFEYKPDIPGKYTVISTFEGSRAYYASSSETTFTVAEESPTQTPMASLTQSVADTYFVPAIAAILVALIIVIALLAIVLIRKHS